MMKWLLILLLLFVPIPFYWDIQPIHFIQKWIRKFLILNGFTKVNTKKLKNILFEFDDVMRAHGIQYWLSEGTALGAIRDGAIIEWDDDLDFGMFESQRKKFIEEVMPDLRMKGFYVLMVNNDSHFFGFAKDGELVDVDIVTRGGKCVACKTKAAQCKTCDSMFPYLGGIHVIEFLGRDFSVPGEDYLEYLYGPDWNVPKKSSLKKKIEGFI
jgi:hypothetical protein